MSSARPRPTRSRRRVASVEGGSVPVESVEGAPQGRIDLPSEATPPLNAHASSDVLEIQGSAAHPEHVASGDAPSASADSGHSATPADAPEPDLGERREYGRGPAWRRGRGAPRPAFDGPPPGRRDGRPMAPRPAPPRGPNSVSAPATRPVRGVPAPYSSSLGRMPAPGESSAGFRSIGRSPEEIARLAQEARREARLNRGRMFRAAAVGQSEPYRALGRGPSTPPSSGANGNVRDRFGSGGARPPSRPGGPMSGRPPTGRLTSAR